MDNKDIVRLAKDPKFISGIYNYCDRWCERCAFTSRCLTYAMSTDDSHDPAGHDLKNETFWNKLKSICEQTEELLRELAAEQGLDLNNLDSETTSDEISFRMSEAKNHELARAGRNYAMMVDTWLESSYPLFKQKEDELNALSRIGIERVDPHSEADQITDAVEVIRWHQHQISVKLMRALSNNRLSDESHEDPELKSDADGSVKVALIGMDRSTGAWGVLQKHFPEKTDSILYILLHLDKMRRKAEELYPQARSFIRPGLDEKG